MSAGDVPCLDALFSCPGGPPKKRPGTVSNSTCVWGQLWPFSLANPSASRDRSVPTAPLTKSLEKVWPRYGLRFVAPSTSASCEMSAISFAANSFIDWPSPLNSALPGLNRTFGSISGTTASMNRFGSGEYGSSGLTPDCRTRASMSSCMACSNFSTKSSWSSCSCAVSSSSCFFCLALSSSSVSASSAACSLSIRLWTSVISASGSPTR